MKNSIFIDNIKNAIKSKEYWFGLTIIVISCVLTSIHNLAPTSIFGDYEIGSSEFFIAATMYSNTLLQISAPLIAIFVCMNRNSLFMRDKEAIQKTWERKEMKVHILSVITIGGSVFLFSFLLLFLFGVIIFPSSTGSIQPYYGLFKELYQSTPVGYIFAYIAHSFVCGALFALFGISIKIFIIKPTNLALFIPLVYYSCFARIGTLFPIKDLFVYIFPLYTFDIAVYDVSPLKRITELSAVLIISMILIAFSYKRNIQKNQI